jgi:dUTP pyrophosphatase
MEKKKGQKRKTMKIKKVRDVKTPSRGTPDSAGIDFFLPKDYIQELKTLRPGESVLIPSGIKANVPDGYGLVAMNKSGVATKQGLIYGAQLVDPDYTGEIHIHVFNVSNQLQTIQPEQKIMQFVLIPINFENVELVDELPEKNTERGSGGFGSTGVF